VSTALPELGYSYVSGGPAIAIHHGPGGPYYSNNNRAPTIGAPFTLCNSWLSRATGELRYLTDSWVLMATRGPTSTRSLHSD
jgi:hypothetical protein